MVKHYWRHKDVRCECGCKHRILANGSWLCLRKLKEELEFQGVNSKFMDLKYNLLEV
jgi:hypothetical protein